MNATPPVRPLPPSIFEVLVAQNQDYALFVLDPEGRVATWNAGAQRIKGYYADEIIGQHFSRFYLPEAVESGWPEHELYVAQREGRFEDEGWRVRKDGSRFWASVIITTLRDEQGNLLGYAKTTRDMTDRRRQEQELRQSEERFRLLVEGVQDYAIYMLDPAGMVTSWNVGAERITGYAREEAIGRHFSQFCTREDIELGKPWHELSTARRTGSAEDEGWRVRKDGSRLWVRATLSALRDDDGHLLGFAQVTQDLTEQRHLQDLEQAARNLQAFIATLAHELRNPLAPIRTAVQAMARMPATSPAHDGLREVIDRQSAHMVSIIDDLIDITRLSRGTIDIHRCAIRVEEVVRRAVEAAAPRIEEAGHELEVACEPDLVIEGDLGRLTQALTNLVNNAARYTPAGGHIWISAVKERGNVVLTVKDTGRGIEPQYMERIFDMFVQGRPSERANAGMGIGLALSRRIAELHNATLTAHSEGEGKGASFVLTIPAVEVTAALVAPPEVEVQRAPASQRILVVDDNEDAAEGIALLLREIGHETQVAHDGSAALAAVPAFAPDVVLLDIGMPGMDGYEVARRMRALGQPLRLIALTGWGQATDRARTAQAGFDMHLLKPVELDRLVAAIGMAA